MSPISASKIKKTWQKPDFYLLATDDVNAKHYPSVREGTGHVIINGNGSSVFVNGSSKGFITRTSGNALVAFQSSAAS